MYTRKVTSAPDSLVENGKFNWGTFNTAISNLNALDAKHPLQVYVPKFYKRFRLKEWQAFQAGNDEWFIFGAVYNAKLTGIVILSVYHKLSGKKYHYQNFVLPSSIKNGNGLNDSPTIYISKNISLQFENELKNNKIFITAFGTGKHKPQIELGLECFHNTEPIVISQPFGKNKGLYSHKALMNVKGNLKIENQLIPFETNNAYCIIDDHKGYYPYIMKYDWLTTAGFDDKGKLCGFNLTDNQIVNPEKYNENCLWHNGKMYPLPPIKVKRTANTWVIQDQYGWVNLKFFPKTENNIKLNFLLVKTDYEGPFGVFEGFINIPDTIKVDFTDYFGAGEKKFNRM